MVAFAIRRPGTGTNGVQHLPEPHTGAVALSLATDGPSVIFKPEVWASDLVRLAGFGPATRRLEGTYGRSPGGGGLMCRLVALMEADCGLA